MSEDCAFGPTWQPVLGLTAGLVTAVAIAVSMRHLIRASRREAAAIG